MEFLDAHLIPIVNGFAYGLLLFTVAAGLTLAFGVADVLNLAHGAIYVAGGYAAVVITDGTWTSLILAVLAGAAVGAAAGGLLSAAVAPLEGRGHLVQALFTFGMALAAGSGLVALFGAEELRPTLPPALAESVSILGKSYSAYRLSFIVIASLLAVAGWLIVSRTQAGARVRATVDDRDMVACLGTSPRAVMSGVLAVAGLLAGMAGALGAPIIGPGPGAAEHVLMLSLIIVVVGRLGSIGGAFVAAIFVGQMQSLGVVLFRDVAPYLLFGAMAVALLLQ
ncbi:MAG: branched-chain amino acid ABC transporter permease, partial [Stackebrandtia sp.]